MQPPGRSTFTQSGLIELGKPVQTLPDGSFVEAKMPKEPRKKKNAEPEIPQPAVGPPPVISGAGKPRGPKEREEAQAPLQVFQPSDPSRAPKTGFAQAPGTLDAPPKRPKLEKGSQAMKDRMAALRAMRKTKTKETAVAAPAAPIAAAAPVAAAKPRKSKKKAAAAEEDFQANLEAARAAKKATTAAAKTDEEDEDMKTLKAMRRFKRMQQLLKESEA
jgi:hypothetical protein